MAVWQGDQRDAMAAEGADGWVGRARGLVARRLAAVRASDLLDLVLPRECGGCLRPGEEWCARCASALDALAFTTAAAAPDDPPPRRTRTATVERAAVAHSAPGGSDATAPSVDGAHPIGGAPWVVPHRAPGGMPPVHAWGIYADPLRAVVSAWKDGGRRDLTCVLEPVLASAIAGALAGLGWADGVVLVVPAPSSRRAARDRGDTPIVDLCRAATASIAGGGAAGAGVGAQVVLRVAPALHHVRRVEDQSGLDTAARRGNLGGAIAVKPLWHNVIRDRRCLVVDDVVTTGATLAEAARALREAGAGPVAGASMAATQRTRG